MTRRAVWAVLFVALAAVGAVAVAGHQDVLHFALGRPASAVLYQCPMHPQIVRDRPGNCPICGMRLVPIHDKTDAKTICLMHDCPMVKAGKQCPMLMISKPGEKIECPYCKAHEAQMTPATDAAIEGYSVITLSPASRQRIGVATSSAVTRDFLQTIRSSARIAYDPELYEAQREYLRLLKSKRIAKQGTGTGTTYLSWAQRVEDARLKLRVSGMTDGSIDAMAVLDQADKTLMIADPGKTVWVYAPVYEFEMTHVKPGQTITVEIPATGRKVQGTVISVDPVLDATTRTVNVRATVSDPQNELRPEMYVNAVIEVPLGPLLSVPDGAVFSTGARNVVFVDKGQGMFEPRDVALGARTPGWVEVKSGLAEGEEVVTSGNFLIDSESRLQAGLKSASGDAEKHVH